MATAPRILAFPSARVHTPSAATSDQSQLLLGPSAATTQLWQHLRRVAPHFRTALLTGEPGSGAEIAARVLHDLSPFHTRAFVTLHHTEAEHRLASRAHTAHEGLLFLPELGRLTPAGQAGVLRLLRQRGPHGLRIVGYARRGLRPLVSAGAFSPELASALAAVRIALPPLRDRSADIPMLASHLVERFAAARDLPTPSLSSALLEAARQHPWPGNLDQLSAAFKWLVQHNPAVALEPSDLEAALESTARAAAIADPPRTRMVKLDDVLQEHIRAVLVACNGNKLRAAHVLGISRSTLYRMLESQPQPALHIDDLPLAM